MFNYEKIKCLIEEELGEKIKDNDVEYAIERMLEELNQVIDELINNKGI